jgi:hypothetical protein
MYKLKLVIFALLSFARTSLASCLPIFPDDKQEKVVLISDRSIYITGEQVRFFASIWNEDDLNKMVKSQILYCEIITPDGNKISGNKILINQSSTTGCIDIPGNLLTGTYYIRAYTKMMRNYGPESYGYQQIRIVNPGQFEILATANSQHISDMQIIQSSADGLKDILLVSVDKTSYSPRDTITLSIQPTIKEVTRIKNICVSVVPEGTKSSSLLLQSIDSQNVNKTAYNSESRGLSISGKLTTDNSANPVSGKKVNLSIIGDGRDFMAVRTDSSGRFFFALPAYYGSRDLFICAEKTALLNEKIWVDNDFCTLPIHLPSPSFNLSELEKQIVLNMAINVQISSHFYSDSLHEKQNTKKEESAFYGKPSDIIFLDKYIQLPTLEEYFNELPSLVKVRKRKGELHFEVLGPSGLLFYDPLVLIDWVAVDEPSKILAVSPQNIARIEVVNQDYLKGGEIYGGIISIISKKGDFAGIDLPSAGLFVNYRFLSENQCLENFENITSALPDTRNTILWKPALSISKSISQNAVSSSGQTGSTNGQQKSQVEKIVFTAPDTPGKYNVIIEGVTTDGEVFSVISVFEVKN